MTKKFNIHDWQAKQRQQLLTEEDEWQKRQDRMTPGKNPEYFYDKDSIIGKLKKDREELFHKEDLEETSTTGTGTSFNAGSGEGYMTPNAFKKKKK